MMPTFSSLATISDDKNWVKNVVIRTKSSSLATLKFVILIASGAATDEIVANMIPLPFLWSWHHHVQWSWHHDNSLYSVNLYLSQASPHSVGSPRENLGGNELVFLTAIFFVSFFPKLPARCIRILYGCATASVAPWKKREINDGRHNRSTICRVHFKTSGLNICSNVSIFSKVLRKGFNKGIHYTFAIGAQSWLVRHYHVIRRGIN